MTRAVILFMSGPPCPDFSIVKSDAPGRCGPEGKKFDAYCDVADQLEEELLARPTLHLCENVIFAQPEEAKHFSQELKAEPVAIDSSDLA